MSELTRKERVVLAAETPDWRDRPRDPVSGEAKLSRIDRRLYDRELLDFMVGRRGGDVAVGPGAWGHEFLATRLTAKGAAALARDMTTPNIGKSRHGG